MSSPRYITPRELPSALEGFCIMIPNVPEFRAALRGFLLTLARCDTWEQIPGITIAPCDAAAWGDAMLTSFEERVTCGES